MNDDLISRQAAIDKLKREEKIFYSPTGLRYLIGAIRDLPSAQQWIPCSERLPDKDGIYLVTHRKFGKLEVTWNIFYGGEHASWLWNDEIIAWMPLPEPYKGEES